MIGKNPYQPEDQTPEYYWKSVLENASPGYKLANDIQSGLLDLKDESTKQILEGLGVIARGDVGSWGGEIWNDVQFLDELAHGKYNEGIFTSLSNKLQEKAGLRSSGHVTLNNQPVHVEPGSFTIKPKMNIAQTDMYMDGEDGKSYTYFQWLNTTGLIISLTIYNNINEKYVGDTLGDAANGETKTDSSLYDTNTQINEALLWWAETFTTVKLWTDLGIPNIGGNYKITQCQQTMEAENIVKTEIELQSYTQDEMEETYYKAYDLDELVDSDQSGDTGLAKAIKDIKVGTKKECDCTGA